MRNIVGVNFKKKFDKKCDTTKEYSYFCQAKAPVGTMVVVDTCYGPEIAKVVTLLEDLDAHRRGAATKSVIQVIGDQPLAPPEPVENNNSTPLW